MKKKYILDREDKVTDQRLFTKRREIIAGILSAPFVLNTSNLFGKGENYLSFKKDMQYSTNEQTNTIKQITSYNNFYELGSGKRDPLINADKLNTENWKLTVDGLVENPITIDTEDLITKFSLEERIYRLRCVEAWSMVIPWIGFELNQLIKKAKPLASAKFVAFQSILDRDNLPGQRRNTLNWPYREGLRLDEAMNPLTIISVGLYGRVLPNQNGSPVRLVVPWKYGFKSIKSIVKISLVSDEPKTSWNEQSPNEYGFYSNVNPNVDHPRWSQATERVIGESILAPRIKTLMFNGYGDEVAYLYSGMDLKKNY